MGRMNYLQSPSGHWNQKSNSDDEAKRYLFCKSRRDISKSSSSSTASSGRMRFLERKPTKTSAPDIRNCDDMYNIPNFIWHQSFAEQTVFFSRHDCPQEQNYLVQRKSESDSDPRQGTSAGAYRIRRVSHQPGSQCPPDYNFLVTRYSGHKLHRMGTTTQPKASSGSTSTDELGSSTGTSDAETFICTEPAKVDACRSDILVSGLQYFVMSLKSCDNLSVSTISCPCIETVDASTSTISPSYIHTCTHTYIETVDTASATDPLKDVTEGTQTATDKYENVDEGTQTTTDKHENVTEGTQTTTDKYENVTEGTQTTPSSPRKIACSEGTQSYLHLIGVGDLSNLLYQEKKSVDVADAQRNRYTSEGTQTDLHLRFRDMSPFLDHTEQPGEFQNEVCSGPKESPHTMTIKCTEVLKISRKSPEPQQGSSKVRKENGEDIPKSPDIYKKDAPEKSNTLEENLQKSSEHKELKQGSSKKRQEGVTKIREKSVSPKSASSVECSTKFSENEVLCTRDVVVIRNIPNSPESRGSIDDKDMDEPKRSILKNKNLGDENRVSEPNQGILQTRKNKKRASVRFSDKEVTAKVDNEEKASLTDRFGPINSHPKRKATVEHRGTQWSSGQGRRSPEVTGCRKFIRKCLTCQCCR